MNVDLAAVVRIAVADIVVGDNDRKVFDPVALGELAKSIAEDGLQSEPIVRPVDGGLFEIVAGERRFRAMSEILGWDEIPARVREMDDDAAAAAMFAENFHRVQLSPIEEAGAFRKWQDRFGWTVDEIAERAKISASRVGSRLRLLDLIDDLQFLVNAGELPLGQAAWLIPLDSNRQRMALRVLRDEPGIDRDRFKAIADELYRQQSEEPLFAMAVEEWELPSVEVAPKALSRKALHALIGRLAEALPADDPLAVEARAAVAAEVAKRSQAASKANAVRRVR